ncbi:MAG: hypothetical protein HPY76_11305 [Anaerolineae bacterium]|jgi:hypothetical protein|nr:hypothetical protein [Anaerolineae bacterium]
MSSYTLSRTRKHHALEHATLHMLARQGAHQRMAGYSHPGGFIILGDISTEDVAVAVEAALARLRRGETSLALQPHCGTNLLVSGALAGTVAWLVLLGAGNDRRVKLERWLMMVPLVGLAAFAAQPLGMMLQANLTTDADPGDIAVREIRCQKLGGLTVHHVLTMG